MKARIHDYEGRLRIEVSPENNDERMLVRAFLRDHEQATDLFVHCIDVEGPLVTFGKKPERQP